MTAEATTVELRRFMAMLDTVKRDGYDELMLTAQSSDKSVLFVARGGKTVQWKISILETKEVPEWGAKL